MWTSDARHLLEKVIIILSCPVLDSQQKGLPIHLPFYFGYLPLDGTRKEMKNLNSSGALMLASRGSKYIFFVSLLKNTKKLVINAASILYTLKSLWNQNTNYRHLCNSVTGTMALWLQKRSEE